MVKPLAGSLLVCALSLLILFSPVAWGQDRIDWAKVCEEASGYLLQYLSIDTSNPPGKEQEGAEFLAGVLKKEGIETQVIKTAPGRAITYARLKGTGQGRPLILLNHIDVVPANAADWKYPPFKGQIIDGEIWGRGAVDMKGTGIAQLQTMLLLKRSGTPPARDVIFLATPDEEVGGAEGAGKFIREHPELIENAEFLLTEGFFIDTADDGTPKYWGVDISEKSVLWLKLTARGDAGHGSMPIPGSATTRLVKALNAIIENPPAPQVLPPVRQFFAKVAASEPEPLRTLYAGIEETVTDPDRLAPVLQDKLKSAMLRNTISLTVLKAGYKTNVIPGEAVAELDCRLLPGVRAEDFIAQIEKTIDDPAVTIERLEWQPTQASPCDTALFRAIEATAAVATPGAPVVPLVVPWSTDSQWFRDAGVIAYGFSPFKLDAEHLATMHSKDERIPVEVFADGVRWTYDIVWRLVASGNRGD